MKSTRGIVVRIDEFNDGRMVVELTLSHDELVESASMEYGPFDTFSDLLRTIARGIEFAEDRDWKLEQADGPTWSEQTLF